MVSLPKQVNKALTKPKAPSSFKKARAPTALSAGFPLPKYLSLLGLQAVLLGFAVIALPRSDLPFQLSTARTKTSLDRPEWVWVAFLSRDPLAFAGWACLGAAVVSAWWAGELGKLVQDRADWERMTSGREETEEEAVARKTSASGKRLKSLRDALLATLIVTPILTAALLLLGAPLPSLSIASVQTQVGTLGLALYLSTLCVFVPVSVLGAPDLMTEGAQGGSQRWMWVRLFVERDLKTPYERALVYPPLFALAGAWLGAFPLALDWDRPWQAWPITPILGATAGYIIGGGWSATKASLEALARVVREEDAKAR